MSAILVLLVLSLHGTSASPPDLAFSKHDVLREVILPIRKLASKRKE
jgi:hypothetical protein